MVPLSGFPSLADGSVDFDSSGAIVAVYNGLPLTAAGKVAVAVEGTPVGNPHNGFLFDATGRLCVTQANPVVTVHNGLGFGSAGRLCVTTVGPFIQHGGLFDATGKLRASGLVFTPPGLSGLSLWLNGNDVGTSIDGTVVTPLPDRSGNGRDFGAFPAGGAVYKAAIRNSKGVLRFTAASTQAYTSLAAVLGDVAPGGQYTLLVALSVTATTNVAATENNPGFCDDDGFIGMHFKDSAGLNSYAFNWDGVPPGDNVGLTSLALGTWGQLAQDHDTATLRIRHNGGAAVTTPSGVTTQLTSLLRLGRAAASGGAANYISMDLGELLMYNRVLPDVERAQAESYLRTGWALP